MCASFPGNVQSFLKFQCTGIVSYMYITYQHGIEMLVPYQFPDLRVLHRNSHIIRDSGGETLVTDGKNFSFLLIKWKLVSCGPMNHFRNCCI